MKNVLAKAFEKNLWPTEQAAGLTLTYSPLLKTVPSFVHGFTTRLGGNSPAPLDSFNLGRHWQTQESKDDAMLNRKRLCAGLSLCFDQLSVPGQQHTTNIEWVDSAAKTDNGVLQFPAVDALATDKIEQPILLHFADCVPVMIVDTKKRVFCVVHAGWRGTAGGITYQAVNFLANKVSSNPKDMFAAVGPAIGSCCYQTGEDVAMKLKDTVNGVGHFIERRNGSFYPDLRAINAMQLLQSGVETIDVSAWCTACRPDLFYSHRQSGGQTGRQGVIACLV